MQKELEYHPYRDQAALDRLLLLIAIFLRYPGIGCPDEDHSAIKEEHHNALAVVSDQLQKLAIERSYRDIANSVPTLRKDLEFLRQYGIMENRMYRWGYYLGTGVFTWPELQIAMQALRDVGQNLGDPTVQALYQKLDRRLRGLDLSDGLLYPVRSQLNRVIVATDPEQMRLQGSYHETLFERLAELETAIVAGQAIEIYYRQSPYDQSSHQFNAIYPLQLLYHDIAWYLMAENVDSGYLMAIRLDRLSNHLRLLPQYPARGKKVQLDQLKLIQQLLRVGWGISLGSASQQQAELAGAVPIKVKVRFFAAVALFIKEGEKRHPRQKIHEKRNAQNQIEFVDYSIKLPERSLDEFWRWVRRFGSQAMVLSPVEAVEQFRQEAKALVARYAELDNN